MLRLVLGTVSVVAPVTLTGLHLYGCPVKVDGISMQPVLNPPDQILSDWVFLNRWKARTFRFNRGEVVSLTDPNDVDSKIIKRIVALEGDTVKTQSYKLRYVHVPPGHCWVEGDHHGHSLDSNLFGPVPLGLIYAKATHIIWPPDRWQRLKVKTEVGRVKNSGHSSLEHWDMQSAQNLVEETQESLDVVERRR